MFVKEVENNKATNKHKINSGKSIGLDNKINCLKLITFIIKTYTLILKIKKEIKYNCKKRNNYLEHIKPIN